MIKQYLKSAVAFIIIVLHASALLAQATKHSNVVALKSVKEKGEILYKQYCLSCHQADGYGVPNMNPPLIKTNYVTGDKRKLILWVLSGSGTNKLSIGGNTYKNKMPAQKYLKDDEIADILTYVRNSFGNKGTMITSTEVKTVRSTIK